MDSFDFIFDNMSKNYENLENVMSAVYLLLQSNPENQELINILGALGSIGEGMISQQIDFTDAYCQDDIKYDVIDNLSSRKEALAASIERDTVRNTR